MVEGKIAAQCPRTSQPGTRRIFLALHCAAIILCASLPANPQAGPDHSAPSTKIETLLHEAQDALNRHDFGAAVKSLKSLVELQPDMETAWFNLGYAYTGLHQNENAA